MVRVVIEAMTDRPVSDGVLVLYPIKSREEPHGSKEMLTKRSFGT